MTYNVVIEVGPGTAAAIRAEAARAAAQTAASTATTQAGIATSAAGTASSAASTATGAAGTATAAAATASSAAASASASATQAANSAAAVIDRAYFATLDTLLADDNSVIGYTGSGADFIVADGDRLSVEGRLIEIKGSTDLAIHAATAGGVGFIYLDYAAGARAATQRLMTKLARDGGNANIVVLGDSTGNETWEWVYLLAGQIAADFPSHTVSYRLWDEAASPSPTYAAAVTIQTGTGANTLTIWNGSVAGTQSNYFAADRAGEGWVTRSPDLIILNYGHNGSTDTRKQLDLLDAITVRIAAEMPWVPVLMIGQNPWLNGAGSMAEKTQEFRAYAARRGYGFVDVYSAIHESPTALASLMADNVHPSVTGQTLVQRTIKTAFEIDGRGASGAATVPATSGVIFAALGFADFARWTVGGNAAIAADTSNAETLGSAVEITNTAGANGWINTDLVGATEIKALRGQWVTMAVRVRVPAGSGITAGRVQLTDGTNSSTTDSGGPTGDDGFYWQIVRLQISLTATYLRAYVYVSTSALDETIQVDRLILARGYEPLDVVPMPETSARKIRLIGSDAAGTMVVRNAASGSKGIMLLSTSSGADDDDPSTEYTVSIGGDLIGYKARGDAYNKIEIVPSSGLIRFGIGTAAPTAGFQPFSATRIALLLAGLEPSGDNSQDLGLANKRWNDVYATQFRPGTASAQPIWTSGTGSPEGVVTAPVGSLYLRENGAAGATLYVKETGTGNFGWRAILGLDAKGAAVADLTVTATTGTLPTPDGSVTIADAAAPTVDELLEYCVELEAKLEAALAQLRAAGVIAT